MSKLNNINIKDLRKEIKDICFDFMITIENRYLYKRMNEIVKNNKKINASNVFHDFVKYSHIESIVLSICRQMDKSDNSQSFINFLDNIFKNIESLSYEWFKTELKKDDYINDSVLNEFKLLFGKLEYIDPRIVGADIASLEHYTKNIRYYRNKKVAHKDKKLFNRNDYKKPQFDISFEKIDKAIKILEELMNKYFFLLYGAYFSTNGSFLPSGLLTIHDGKHEEDIFRVPWIVN